MLIVPVELVPELISLFVTVAANEIEEAKENAAIRNRNLNTLVFLDIL
jgi:hypothetical protein